MTSTRRRTGRLLSTIAMVLIGITASVPLPASAQSGKQIVITGRSADRTFQVDVNMPGSDYRSERLGANNPQLCQQLCDNASVCRAWTFVKAGLQGPQAVCWLKNSVPRAIRDTNTISGVKLEARQPVAFGFDMPGNDYRSAAIGAWADCQRICDQETPCKAWSWLGPNVQGPRAMCLLKNDVPARVARQNVASGVKAASTAPAEQQGIGSAQTPANGPASPTPIEGSMQGSAAPAGQSGSTSAEPTVAQQGNDAQGSTTPPPQQAGEAASSSMSQQGGGQSSEPSSTQQAGETASSAMQQQGNGPSGASSSVQQTANDATASPAQPTDGATPGMPLRSRAERRAALVAATQKGLQNGVDMPGKDYRNVALSEGANAAAACQSLCMQDAPCKAWTWVKAGIQGPKVMCWLKNEVPRGVSNPNTVSGLKAP